MPSCSPPSISVRDYFRAPPRRRKKRKPPKGRYYVCENASGTLCGTHHRTRTAAVKHRKQLDTTDRRAGRRATWNVEARDG